MSDINNITANNPFDQLGLSGSSPTKSRTELAQEDFLKLLTTQMSFQDPMNPTDPGEFLGQLAEFGTVDGIQKLNQTVGAMNAGLYSNQALQASALVGRNVKIESNIGYLSPEGGMNGAVIAPQDVQNLTVSVTSDKGEVIKKVSLGDQKAGVVDFKWDGTGNDGTAYPAGKYHMTAEGTIGGTRGNLQTLATANVDSVTLGQGSDNIALNLNGLGMTSFYNIWQIS